MPLSFYLSCFALVGLTIWSWHHRYQGWGLPACMVLGTVAVWYVGDVLYNGAELYLSMIGPESFGSAWWQVLWFLVGFSVLIQPIHRRLNRKYLDEPSHIMAYLQTDCIRNEDTQHRLDRIAKALFLTWLLLISIGLIRVKGNALGWFAPYLSPSVNPWARGQIGGGISAFLSLGLYIQTFLTAAIGVIAALAIHPKTRNTALLICGLMIPMFILTRTRNLTLATVIPGFLAFVFIRFRGSMPLKIVLIILGIFTVHIWFTIVMSNRSGMQFDVQAALSGQFDEDTRHEGLNMLAELALIDRFIETDTFSPNGGQRYFAEIVNPIPRGLWKDKPMIGLDYAVARGQKVVGSKGEVTATVSTGMIGQGVVNFGRIWGPVAAAALMAFWVAVLARQDLRGSDPGRIVLYGTGTILTFNLGRDITLLTLYPFIFGLAILWFWNRTANRSNEHFLASE